MCLDCLHLWRVTSSLDTSKARNTLLFTDMIRQLHVIQMSTDDQCDQIKELHARSALLEQDIELRAHRQSSQTGTRQPEEALRPLKQEINYRIQQGEELGATLSETKMDLQTAEETLQV